MANGFNDFSLALFTTLAPSGVVAFIAVAIARLWAPHHEAAERLDRVIVLPFAVALLGFIASATHLGTPANALHVFSGVGRSPLSNEVLAAVVFLFLAGSYWMASFRERFPDGLAHLWLVLACGAGVALLACTSLAYSARTVPTWNTPFTPANLLLGALYAGPVLGLLFLFLAHARPSQLEVALGALSAAGLVTGVAVLVFHLLSLTSISNNVTSADALAPNYGTVIVMYAILGVGALSATLFSLRRRLPERLGLILRLGASALALGGVFAIRTVFYGLYMTVGF